MIDLIFQISPNLVKSDSKICTLTAFNHKYLAFVVDSVSIKLIDHQTKAFSNAVLNSPHSEDTLIRCIRFSHNDLSPTRLISCASQSVLIWNLYDIFLTKTRRAIQIGNKNWFTYEINDCSFHPSNNLIGILCGNSILIIDVEKNSKLTEIGLNECINSFEFSLFHSNFILISIETSLVVFYDFYSKRVAQEIRYNDSKSMFIDICGLENEPLVLMSSSDGVLHLNEYINGRFLGLRKIQLGKLKEESQTDESAVVCIGLEMFSTGPNSNDQKIIACACLDRIYILDLYSGNLIKSFEYDIGDSEEKCIPQRVDFCLSKGRDILASVLYVFKNEIDVIKLMELLPNEENKKFYPQKEPLATMKPNSDSKIDDFILTVFPKLKLLENSPLNEKIHHLNEENKTIAANLSMQDYIRKNSNSLIKRDSSLSKDKPLTFNSRIKSSGYNTTSVKRERFQPLINKSASSNRSSSLAKLNIESAQSRSHHNIPVNTKNREFTFQLPNNLKKKIIATDKSSPIIDLKFSNNGQNFVYSSSDNLIQYCSSALPDKPSLSFNLHQDTIRSIDISHNGKFLLSASNDKTCKLWSLKQSGKLLIDIKSLDTTKSAEKIELKKEPSCAQFFYLDKFLLIGSDKNLFLCKYFIDTSKNEIQRYLNNSSCKLVNQMSMTFSQSISCLSSINSFYSYLVLCAGSNKDIEVFDLNESKSCLTIHEAHTRPLSQLAQNQSEFNQVSYDIFLSNSCCDGVKIWDLRTASCVNRFFDAHLNRYLATKCSFSADSNYVVVGSEDRTAVVYDIRMSGGGDNQIVKRYGTFSDSVSCAQFNPKSSQLLCSTLDGKLFNYQD